MQTPLIDVSLSKSLVATDDTVTVDVVVRIVPPLPQAQAVRPPLNLGLVLDRSGSMSGHAKLPYAIGAAVYAVEQLLPTDRVSVTLYDNRIETPVQSTLATDKPAIIKAFRNAGPGGSTDLHGGWSNGMTQVRAYLEKNAVNRVLLLSDGLANVGVTDPNQIARGVAEALGQGISTSTIGVGNDYNEHLMLQIAQSGGGNYYFVHDPVGFQDLFQSELHGLMNLMGTKVSLGVEGVTGVTVVDQLNDFERLPTGNYKLPEMVAGIPVPAVFRLKAGPMLEHGNLCKIRLAWDDPSTGRRHSLKIDVPLHTPIPVAEWNKLETNTEVTRQVGLLFNARAQREFSQAVEQGDEKLAKHLLEQNLELLKNLPESVEILEELAYVQSTAQVYMTDALHARKRGHYRSQARRNALLGKIQRNPKEEPPSSPPGQP